MSTKALTAMAMDVREQLRRPLLILLLVIVPLIFITWSFWVTEEQPHAITLPGDVREVVTMRDLHGAVMVPITVAFLAGLVGLFMVRSALDSDRRLVVAGFRPGEVIVPRIVVLGLATLVVLAVSLAVTSADFTPQRWLPFVAGNLLAGLAYGGIGAVAGALLGRLGAAYFMFFMPMIDFGIAQNPMFFAGRPQEWATALPGWGSTRVIVDGAFSAEFAAFVPLLVAVAWLTLVGLAVALLLRQAVASRG